MTAWKTESQIERIRLPFTTSDEDLLQTPSTLHKDQESEGDNNILFRNVNADIVFQQFTMMKFANLNLSDHWFQKSRLTEPLGIADYYTQFAAQRPIWLPSMLCGVVPSLCHWSSAQFHSSFDDSASSFDTSTACRIP